jgi:S1-C subfamily serine protease
MSAKKDQSGPAEPPRTWPAPPPPPPPPPPPVPVRQAGPGWAGYGSPTTWSGGDGYGGYGGQGITGDEGGPDGKRHRKARHRRHVYLGVTAAAVGLAVGAVGVRAATGGSSGAATTASTALSTSQIAARVDKGLVDVVSTLGYQNAEAAGTGQVMTSSGLVLTNNHVIDGATSIKATDVGNGRTYPARVVGYDKTDDVAVLQLEGASGLATVSYGNSSGVTTGLSVVALGNAGGKGGTPSVAAGTVTALNQAITASDEGSGTTESLSGMIETNADIQPGDSGGPLVNSAGQVVGMDTAALSPSATSSPYGQSPYGQSPYGQSPYGQSGGQSSSGETTTQGYAIPANKALSIASEIESGKASGTVHIGETAFLGVQIASAASDGGFSGFGGEQDSTGVTVEGALSGSPAAAAGLSAGDVIDSVGGHTVTSPAGLQTVIGQYHPGDKVSVVFTNQDGQTQTATVTLANGPAD